MVDAQAVDWNKVVDLAFGLGLPGVTKASLADGSQALFAHDRLWVWWDRGIDEPGFRMPKREREFLIAASPEVFFISRNERDLDRVYARSTKVNPRWIQANLALSWRALAPEFFVEQFPGVGPPVPQFSDP